MCWMCRPLTAAVMQAGVGLASSNYQAYAHSNVAGLTNVLEVAKVSFEVLVVFAYVWKMSSARACVTSHPHLAVDDARMMLMAVDSDALDIDGAHLNRQLKHRESMSGRGDQFSVHMRPCDCQGCPSICNAVCEVDIGTLCSGRPHKYTYRTGKKFFVWSFLSVFPSSKAAQGSCGVSLLSGCLYGSPSAFPVISCRPESTVAPKGQGGKVRRIPVRKPCTQSDFMPWLPLRMWYTHSSRVCKPLEPSDPSFPS